jgi:hypothetical protein
MFPLSSRLLDWERGTHRHLHVPATSPTELHLPRPATAGYSSVRPDPPDHTIQSLHIDSAAQLSQRVDYPMNRVLLLAGHLGLQDVVSRTARDCGGRRLRRMTTYAEGNPIRLPLTEFSEQWEIDAMDAAAALEPTESYDHDAPANEPTD